MPESTIVTVRGNDSVAVGLEKLVAHHITSLPVFDVNEERFNALLSFLDICAHTTRIYSDKSITDDQKLNAWRRSTCSEIANLSKSCSYQYIRDTDNIKTAILKMVSLSNIRRLPVMNLKDDLVGILTQSQIVNVISQQIDLFPVANLTIEDISLGTLREVKTVNINSLVKEAFFKLVEYHIYGIPVVDDKNNVVGNLSASDIQLIAVNGEFSKFDIPISQILPNANQKRVPVVVQPRQTISEAFKIMGKERIHRLFVVDGGSLVGLLSPVDLIQSLLDHSI